MMNLFAGSPKKKVIIICLASVVIAGMIAGLTLTALASKSPESTDTPLPTASPAPPHSTPPPFTPEPQSGLPMPEPVAMPSPPPGDSQEEVFDLYGPQSRGCEITIAGKTFKLPEDAQPAGEVISYGGIAGVPCEICNSLPFLVILRGDSVIWIGLYDGKVVKGSIADGEAGAFDFLKQVFPDQAEAVDSLPVRVVEEGAE